MEGLLMDNVCYHFAAMSKLQETTGNYSKPSTNYPNLQELTTNYSKPSPNYHNPQETEAPPSSKAKLKVFSRALLVRFFVWQFVYDNLQLCQNGI